METGLGLSDVQLEASDLWIPGFDGQEYNLEPWLTRLACALIESGFVQDEILLILSPMCKTKVTFDSVRFMYIMSSCAYELIWCHWEVHHEEELHSSVSDYLKKKVKDAKKLKHSLI